MYPRGQTLDAGQCPAINCMEDFLWDRCLKGKPMPPDSILKMEFLMFFARLALAIVFAVAGLAKLLDLPGSRKSLVEFGLPVALTSAFAVILPLAELACAIALVREHWAVTGAVGATALLTVLSVGLSVNLVRGEAPNCHCFGKLSSSRVTWWTVFRNLVLLAIASLVAWKADQLVFIWPSFSINFFEAAMCAAVGALAVVLTLAFWFLFHLLKQNGRLMLRLEAVESRLKISPSAEPSGGLPLGNPAPAFSLNAIEGGTTTLEQLGKETKYLLLVFTEPGCEACESLQPELAFWQGAYEERVTIVLISGGALEANRDNNAVPSLRNLLLQADREVAGAYLVSVIPSAILVEEGKIASNIAAGPDAIRGLVQRSVLSPVLKKGAAVPSLKLLDLAGETNDLARFRGRGTLILFWNPFCGHCQNMLPEIKNWEHSGAGALQLVVISSGSLEASQRQGFRATVLLDPYFVSAQVFGATGTPSAVVLDEEGRLETEVVIGAPSVLRLVKLRA